jgi:hypothetical protein
LDREGATSWGIFWKVVEVKSARPLFDTAPKRRPDRAAFLSRPSLKRSEGRPPRQLLLGQHQRRVGRETRGEDGGLFEEGRSVAAGAETADSRQPTADLDRLRFLISQETVEFAFAGRASGVALAQAIDRGLVVLLF